MMREEDMCVFRLEMMPCRKEQMRGIEIMTSSLKKGLICTQ